MMIFLENDIERLYNKWHRDYKGVYAYEKKLMYLKKLQGNICPVCNMPMDKDKIDLHHKYEDGSKLNVTHKKYPLAIDSIHNLVAVHHDCHLNGHKNGKLPRLTYWQIEQIENEMRKDIEKAIEDNELNIFEGGEI